MFGRFQRWMNHRAVSDDSNLSAVAKNLAFADLERLWVALDRYADTISSGIAHRRRPDVFDHREHHVAHFAFVFRRHQDDVGDSSQVSSIEQPMVSWSIATSDATPIQAELDV